MGFLLTLALTTSALVLGCFYFFFDCKLFKFAYWVYSDTPLGAFLHKQLVNMNPSTPHSKPSTTDGGSYYVVSIPMFSDNYAYILIDKATGNCALVDPADAKVAIEAWNSTKKEYKDSKQMDLSLTHVLTTHKHWDHSGGNSEIAAAFPGIEIVGGVNDHVESATKHYWDGNSFSIGSLTIVVYAVPCHTKGHVLFHVVPAADQVDTKAVFTGDTLFVAGAGKFFEGNGEQMYRNMYKVLGDLSEDCLVFCGHEYTVDNLKFATFMEPENEDILRKIKWATEQRKQCLPTIPSTIAEEKKINPFMRVHLANVAAKTPGATTPEEVMAAVRRLKDDGAHKQRL